MLKSGAEPLASPSAQVAEEDHQDECGAGGNPGSSQEDSAQPVGIVEPMEPEESMESLTEGEPLEITLPVNPLSSSTGCTVSCDELQSENRQLRNKVKSLQKKVASQKGICQNLQKEKLKSK